MGSDRLLRASVILPHLHSSDGTNLVEVSFVLQIDREPVYADHSTLLQIPYTFFVLWSCKVLKS